MHRPPCRQALLFLLAFSLCACAAAQVSLHRHAVRRALHGSNSAPAEGASILPVSSGNWSQLGELSPSSHRSYYTLGYSVAVSGDIVVVGSLTSPNGVAAFIFRKPANGWQNTNPIAALTVPPTRGFLVSVAMEGDTIVVGASDSYYGPGTAYVFVKPAGGWANMNPTATLSSTESMASDDFGRSVSISGDTVVVGADGVNSYTGAAYVFVRPAQGWTDMTQTARLAASDAQMNDDLGRSVSISGDSIAVGASGSFSTLGAAYVFVKPSTGWVDMTQTAKLAASDGQAGSGLGTSISIESGTVLAGALNIYTSVGAAYLFVQPPSGWRNMTQTSKLVAADGRGDYFGASVVLRGKIALVGAPLRSRQLNFDEGGVYVFTEPASGWQGRMASSTVLTASDGHHFSWFGDSVALDGKLLVGGAPTFQAYGTAYVFGLP